MSAPPVVWAMVPARGGSKSIPGKNVAPLAGVPLIAYAVGAAVASGRFARIVASTDDAAIAECCRDLGIEVDDRPDDLATDEADITDAVMDWVSRLGGAAPPAVIGLIQPTNPFLVPSHIGSALDALAADPAARSVQTVVTVPHIYHAWNQRERTGAYVRFRYPDERTKTPNKQAKPDFFALGNFLAVRTEALMAGEGLRAEPSIGVDIPHPYGLDVDGPDDLRLAEAILAAGLVELPEILAPRDA
jgi:CMP-N-acetylneuraminic acid synthetase